MKRSVKLAAWAVILVSGLAACDEDPAWDDEAAVEDEEAALARRAGPVNPPLLEVDPGTWVDEHTVACDQPGGGVMQCGEGVLAHVHLNGTPSLSEFCGRAKPTSTQLSGNTLWVKWGWCLGAPSGCSPLNVGADKLMAHAWLGACEVDLRIYSSYYSNFACSTGRCAWTDADISHCTGLTSSTPVTIKYY